jgi:hypothetical protein
MLPDLCYDQSMETNIKYLPLNQVYAARVRPAHGLNPEACLTSSDPVFVAR